MIGGSLGVAAGLQNSGITYSTDGDKLDWGTAGMQAALSYYYFPIDFLGVGAEISGGSFNGADKHWYSYSEKFRDHTQVMNLFLSARFTVNPKDRVRFYVPGGAGWTVAEQKLKIKDPSFEKHSTEVSFGWFAGLGAEWDIWDDVWSAGVEVRYHTFKYDTDALTHDAPSFVKGEGKRRYSYLVCFFKISKRF